MDRLFRRIHQAGRPHAECHRVTATVRDARDQDCRQENRDRAGGLTHSQHHLYHRLQQCHLRQQREQSDG